MELDFEAWPQVSSWLYRHVRGTEARSWVARVCADLVSSLFRFSDPQDSALLELVLFELNS
jgi:hypothetical protein